MVTRYNTFKRVIVQYWLLYLMLLPGIIYYLVFRFLPMAGLVMAFQDYKLVGGIFASPWVGFKYFDEIFTGPFFGRILFNSFYISFLKLLFGYPAPIILALMLNEVRRSWFKKLVQTITYLPNFLSWVIIYGMVLILLSPSTGLVNEVIKAQGADPINFLTDKTWFIVVLVASSVWAYAGYSAVIYLAALSNISPELYEAATIDGASRMQQVWYVSLPGIRNVMMVLLILSMGSILDAGFAQIYIFYNPQVYQVSDIIDTWVFRNGVEQLQISLSTAMGFFRSVVGLVMIVGANWTAKKVTGSGLW
ncbi:MAG: ABC transporter permease subunit [Anaerolineaceae bacterium]|jgi:putative aldouronate transport system permease protein